MGKKINKQQKNRVMEAISGVIEEKKAAAAPAIEQLSALQVRERNERTAFVGNIPIDATGK
jgi:ribosomal protein L11 methylase PrmA